MIVDSFLANVENALKNYSDLPALTDFKGETITYGQVANKIAGLHLAFTEYGLRKGDKVAIIGRNSANWGIVFLSVVTYGAVAVPVLHEFTAENVHNIINHSDSKVLFAGKHSLEQLELSEMPNLEHIAAMEDFATLKSNKQESENNIGKAEKEKHPERFSPETLTFHRDKLDELMMISYTSGTTGYSKGVMLSYGNLMSNMIFGKKVMSELKSGDKIVAMLPMAHMYGLAFEFLYEFIVGCHIHFLSRLPTPQIILEAFAAVKPRIVVTVPLIVEKIFKKRLMPAINKPIIKAALKIPMIDGWILNKINKKLTALFGGNFIEIIIGGAAFNAEAEKFFKRIKLKYTVGYGMTECAPIITYEQWSKVPLFSCGKAAPGMEVKIESTDRENVPGEILVRGDNVMSGYYKNPEATAETFTHDGWMRTGDLGVIDAHGYLFIKGRSKNMILGASGQNIYPEEIESKLNNTDYVSESVVIEDKGKIVALVFPDRDIVDRENLEDKDLLAKLEEIRTEINAQLPNYSQISRMKIHPSEFEKTPKKSVKRYLYTDGNNL